MKQHRRRRPLAAFTAGVLGLTLAITGATSAAAAPDIERISGENRYETAARVAAEHHSGGADTVYVALGTDFPDALTGAPAATVDDAPVLLVQSSRVPAATREAIEDLNPDRIHILGGTRVIRTAVLNELRSIAPGARVARLAGENRYETSAQISAATFTPGVPVAYLVSGQGYPDALAGAPVAGANQAPILLTQRNNVPQVVRAELNRLNPGRIVNLGGTSAVTRNVATALEDYSNGRVSRLQGDNRYETSTAISAAAFPNGADVVYLSTGRTSPTPWPADPQPPSTVHRSCWSSATTCPTPCAPN